MPTARELLQQADALMRRNRVRGAGAEIPELTDEERGPRSSVRMPFDARRQYLDLDDVPELTDAVEEIEAPSIQEIPEDDDEMSRWLELDRGEVSITGPAPDSIAVVPPEMLLISPSAEAATEPEAAVDGSEAMPSVPDTTDEAAPLAAALTEAIAEPPAAAAAVPDAGLDAAPAESAAPSPIAAMVADEVAPSAEPLAPAAGGDTARWDALAEEVRMQVLQRIDIFTDTGLREQLTARLQPIVDRASADLVVTINEHLGQLLRAYVAEAIEREIEKCRQGNG